MTKERIIARNNINIFGSGPQTLMLAHGFGCDQTMWQEIVRGLGDRYTIVLFDYVGSGRSQLSAFSKSRYQTLEGYAGDIVEICQALDLENVTLVSHSVSGMIGLLATLSEPDLFDRHIMVCPSPCFLNDPPDYYGGFERSDLEELIDLMDKNYLGWADYLAPLVVGIEASDELIGQLKGSFCSTDPVVAKSFARAAFFSDSRPWLKESRHPTLILQSEVDYLANKSVGRYMHAHMPNSRLRLLNTQGHCIHMTDPAQVLQEIRIYLEGSN